jgi:hypothetical protein
MIVDILLLVEQRWSLISALCRNSKWVLLDYTEDKPAFSQPDVVETNLPSHVSCRQCSDLRVVVRCRSVAVLVARAEPLSFGPSLWDEEESGRSSWLVWEETPSPLMKL